MLIDNGKHVEGHVDRLIKACRQTRRRIREHMSTDKSIDQLKK